MSYQSTLGPDNKRVTEARVFYREVKSENRLVTPEEKTIIGESNLEAVDELLNYIKRQKLRYPVSVDETGMAELHKELVVSLLENEEERELGPDVKVLLSQFCEDLSGPQLAENKYAMLLYFGSAFLLAHVKAERGISIKESGKEGEDEIELIRRFLDVDNILSAALFELDNGSILMSHFTDPGSDSFRDFLGVSERHYHYQKKNIQILCYYNDLRNFECKFEFSNGELEDQWLTNNNIRITDDRLVFANTNGGENASHRIKEIRWGGSPYSSVNAFKSDFKEYSYDIDGEFRRYQRLLSAPSESTISIFEDSVAEVVDRQSSIEVKYENGEYKREDKGDLPDNLHTLFASGNIKLDSGFASRIYQDIMNNRDCYLYHASEEAASAEFSLGKITFLNVEENDMTLEMRSFLEQTHRHMVNATGQSIRKCLCSIVLQTISEVVNQSFNRGLQQLININEGSPRNQDVVTTREGEGDGLIEYKNRQDIETDDPAESIVSRIKTEKNKGFDTKIFLWGITEQSRNFDGLSTQEWNDDRVSGIETHVHAKLEDKNIQFNGFDMRPIPLGANGDKWVIAGILY